MKQSCRSLPELSSTMLHSFCRRQDRVDSRLFVVGSQTGSLTPDSSFAHNLGCRCPNGSCEAILDIYTSRPFQRYKEHLKARCFSLCCRALNLWESRRTPNLGVWVSSSHLAQSGVATDIYLGACSSFDHVFTQNGLFKNKCHKVCHNCFFSNEGVFTCTICRLKWNNTIPDNTQCWKNMNFLFCRKFEIYNLKDFFSHCHTL